MKAVTWTGASLMALGACSDGSDGSGPPTTLAGYDAEFAELVDDAAGLEPTDPAALPTTGSADYEGVIRLVPGADPFTPDQLSGTLDLAVDFGTQALTGEATNFVISDSEDAVTLDGSLDITGDISRDPTAESGVFADIGGTLTPVGDPEDIFEEIYGVDGTLRGEFLGEDAEVIVGNVSGTIRNVLVPDYIAPPATLGGDFIVER